MRFFDALLLLEDKIGFKFDKKQYYDFDFLGIAPLELATSNHISYVDKEKYTKEIANSKVGALLIRQDLLNKAQIPESAQILIVPNPHLAFAYLSHLFAKPEFEDVNINYASKHKGVQISPTAFIGKNVLIGKNTQIMAGVAISDNVKIGENCKIYPNVVIYRDCVIGDNVNIHAGSIIGSDGFGYAHTALGEHVKIEHNGIVEVQADVEIGANTTIDRAVFGKTIIKQGAKIDNLVQVGHNCIIGESSIIVSQVGLAGSTTTGRNVIMGGQAGTGGHLHIGDFVTVAGRGAISKDLPNGTKWGGHPMMELSEWIKFYVTLRRIVKKSQNSKKS